MESHYALRLMCIIYQYILRCLMMLWHKYTHIQSLVSGLDVLSLTTVNVFLRESLPELGHISDNVHKGERLQ